MSELFTWVNIRFLLQGLLTTVVISVTAILLSILLGLVIAIGRNSEYKVLRGIAGVISRFLKIRRSFVDHADLLCRAYSSAWVSRFIFTLFTSAGIAEILRGGFSAIPGGQWRRQSHRAFHGRRRMCIL